jgi:hypothetical protein
MNVAAKERKESMPSETNCDQRGALTTIKSSPPSGPSFLAEFGLSLKP